MKAELFVDYYGDLQVSPNADGETIERVYRMLAKKWHPDNEQSGNVSKFNQINTAYHVLRDPEKRAAYDAGYETQNKQQWQIYSANIQPSQKVDNDKAIRLDILSILYVARRQDPDKPDVGIWRLEQLLGWPEKEIGFHIWYLKEKKWIYRSDSGGFAITADGADVVEDHKSFGRENQLLIENKQQSTGMKTAN